MKIKDLVVGTNATINLVIKTAAVKTTKSNKPYLSLDLFDGCDSIQANCWDWYKDEIPKKNEVFAITAAVGEWAGNKQLTIKTLTLNTSAGIEEFAPRGDVDINACVQDAKDLIECIEHQGLHDVVLKIFKDNAARWRTVPGAKSVHHAYVGGTLQHSVETAKKAKAIAELIPTCDVSLCIAGALLHDLGKLWTYNLEGVVIDYTLDGESMEHISLGAVKLVEYMTPENEQALWVLQHIILSHHGVLEHGSPVTPHFLEAWVVHYADAIDARTATVRELNAKAPAGATHTEKSWVLGCAMFTQELIHSKLR